MARIFASADVATLVATFPPTSPTNGRASLVRSASGTSLVSSQKLLDDFRILLETSPERIKLSDLPQRLGVGKTDWLFNCFEGPLYYSGDEKCLIPWQEARSIRQAIYAQLKHRVILSFELLAGSDVSADTLNQLLDQRSDEGEWAEGFRENAKHYFYSSTFVNNLQATVKSVTSAESSQGIDLNEMFPHVPTALLKQLGDDALKATPGSRGEFAIQNDHVKFVPDEYSATLENNRQAVYESKIQAFARQVRDEGFCNIPEDHTGIVGGSGGSPRQDDRFLHDVRSRLEDQTSIFATEIRIENTDKRMLVANDHLEEALKGLRLAAPQEATRVWYGRHGGESTVILKRVAVKLLDAQLNTELKRLLLKTQYRTDIEECIVKKLNQLQVADLNHFSNIITEQLLIPLNLHSIGLTIISDETLREHLEDFIGEHFRHSILPGVLETLREQNLLLDRYRRKELEKMQQACTDAKGFTDIRAAITKMAKRQKIEQPSTESLQRAKKDILQRKVKAMRKMTRGSDLLQNLVWIMLAQNNDGLFMSSGKDTSRMIKQYQAIGDDAIGLKLVAWRDLLKSGTESSKDLQEMRNMATQAVLEVSESLQKKFEE